MNKQNKNRLIDTGREFGGWVKKVKGLSKNNNNKKIGTDNRMVITRGKKEWGKGEGS